MTTGHFRRRCLAAVIGSGMIVPALAPSATAAEVLTPARWAGRWDFTITYRDGATGRVAAVDHTSNDLCPSEPLGLALLAVMPTCESDVTETDLVVHCAAESNVETCAVESSFDLRLQLSGKTLNGYGEWTAATAGDCASLAGRPGQSIEISATRRGPLPRDACAQPSSLLRKFVSPAAALMPGVPFAALTVDALDIDRHGFEVEGLLRLGPRSDGIDPRREAVTLQVGAFATKVPPGSFRLKPDKSRKAAQYTFEGTLDGARLELKIVTRADGSFEYRAEGQGVHMAATRPGPVALALAVGNDGGTIAARTGSRGRCER